MTSTDRSLQIIRARADLCAYSTSRYVARLLCPINPVPLPPGRTSIRCEGAAGSTKRMPIGHEVSGLHAEP
jgi:hypothetical protein